MSKLSYHADELDDSKTACKVKWEKFEYTTSHKVAAHISFMCSNTGYDSLSKSGMFEHKFLRNSIHFLNNEQILMCCRQHFDVLAIIDVISLDVTYDIESMIDSLVYNSEYAVSI
jgi:hypothetical protein